MKYAKLIDGELVPAPRKMQTEIGGVPYTVYNPPDEMLEADGWLPVIEEPMPDNPPEGYHYEPFYTEQLAETGMKIYLDWQLVKDPDDISDSEALEIIVGGGTDDTD